MADGSVLIVTTERHSYRTRVYARFEGCGHGAYVGSLYRPACPENVERMSQGKRRLYRAGFATSYPVAKSWEAPELFASSTKARDWLVSKALEAGLLN
jgi:hypothetical protein